MSHSKRRARGKSYYLDVVNREAARYVRACAGCGRKGFDPEVVEREGNRHLVAEFRHLYEPLVLNGAGLCAVCAGG